jgi:hypothetical protein
MMEGARRIASGYWRNWKVSMGAAYPLFPPSSLREITTRMISLVPSRI